MTGRDFDALTPEQKEAVFREAERIGPGDGAPLTPAQRRRWEGVRRAMKGRPRVGRGAARVQVTVERGLLEEADAYARRNGMTRAQLIARGIRLALSA
jgi:hypothetical protein